jgi:hypothetical protein
MKGRKGRKPLIKDRQAGRKNIKGGKEGHTR